MKAKKVRPANRRFTDSDRNQSLQQIDGKNWGEPTLNTHVVKECHRLRQIPLCRFTIEDLRLAIGQSMGLEYLVPLALERLRDDPLAEGAYYPCDLLVNVLGVDQEFWKRNSELRDQTAAIAEQAFALFPDVPDIANSIVTKVVHKAYNAFRKCLEIE